MEQEKASIPSQRRVILPLENAQPVASKPSYKKWMWVGVLAFFLFSGLCVVPIGKLPLLNKLAGIMGLSAEEAQSVGFARALLTWTKNGFSGSYRENEKSLSMFNRQQRAGFNAEGPQSGLFDLAALNASRRARGLRPDGLVGAYVGVEGENDPAYNGRVNGWSQEAAAAAEKNKQAQDVYFGEDADVARRAVSQQGATKGSADTASLHVKSNIVGAGHADWLGVAIDKASSLGLGELEKELQKASGVGTGLSNLQGSLKAGGKPQQDLARTWLLSSAANKAQQLMLKKQLAGAGYMAIEMPKKVYDSMGENAGLMMRGDEVVADFEQANSLLLDEDTCRDLSKQANSNIAPKKEESEQLISQITTTHPTSCGNGITAWKEQISRVKQNCREVNSILSNMKSSCGATVTKEGACETVYLDSYATELTDACDALAAAELEDPRDDDKIAQLKAARDNVVKNYNQSQAENSFSSENGFFSETENKGWQQSLSNLNGSI